MSFVTHGLFTSFLFIPKYLGLFQIPFLFTPNLVPLCDLNLPHVLSCVFGPDFSVWNVPCAHAGQDSSRPQTACALAARVGMPESSGRTPSQPQATLHPPRQTSEQDSPSQGRERKPPALPRPSACHVPRPRPRAPRAAASPVSHGGP